MIVSMKGQAIAGRLVRNGLWNDFIGLDFIGYDFVTELLLVRYVVRYGFQNWKNKNDNFESVRDFSPGF